jgi:hypothetical protein
MARLRWWPLAVSFLAFPPAVSAQTAPPAERARPRTTGRTSWDSNFLLRGAGAAARREPRRGPAEAPGEGSRRPERQLARGS